MIQSKEYIIHQIADDYRTKINLILIGGGAIGQIRTVLDARPTFGVHVRILGDFYFTIYTSKL